MRFSVFCSLALVLAQPLLAYTPGTFYYVGHSRDKVIALTFDDGPGPFTPKILDYLKQHNARATFFIEGDQVASYPQHVRQIRDEGHELANHTFSHLDFHKVKERSAEVFIKEFESTENAIRKALGDPSYVSKAMRMPHGAYGKFNRAWLLPILKERGCALVHWSFGEDWLLKLSAEKMAADYIHNAAPGAIFLMHDGGRRREKIFAALQIIIPALEQKGYRFVAAEDLFKN